MSSGITPTAAASPRARPALGGSRGDSAGHDAGGRRGWLAAAAAVVLAFVLLGALGDVLAPGPGGPASSSFATSAPGLAAWAELLARADHPVTQLRQSLERATLDPRHTLVLLDPDAVLRSEGRRLEAFVAEGGRLIVGGANPERTLPALIGDLPRWSARAPRIYTPDAAAGGLAGVGHVSTAGRGAWLDADSGERALSTSSGAALLLVRRLGRGELYLLADASPLQNRLLARTDNAQLALDLAGAAGRPVAFVESVHGYGQRRGLAALPGRLWLAVGLLVAAGLAWLLARGRRLGPPEDSAAAAAPPRRAYVEALALLLRRAGAPREMAKLLRAAAERELTRHGLPSAAAAAGAAGGQARDGGAGAATEPGPRRRALRRLGLSEREAGALLDDVPASDERARLLDLAAALVRLRGRS